MNNELAIFRYHGDTVRVVRDEQGEPWWVAKDVAESLGYIWNGAPRVAHVPEEWRGVTSVVTHSGVQEMITLSEQGLYFFLGRSDKAAALPMQKWVAGEVLPFIRKTGSYSLVPQTLPDALRAYAKEIELRVEVQSKLAIAAPKAEFYDVVTGGDSVCRIGTLAKILDMGMINAKGQFESLGPNNLFRFLRDEGVLIKHAPQWNHPYSTQVDAGHFRMIESKRLDPEDNRLYYTTVVLPKGQAYIRNLLLAAGYVHRSNVVSQELAVTV
jgi:prophage antirepressor-like protein